jgi:hypothetical protein
MHHTPEALRVPSLDRVLWRGWVLEHQTQPQENNSCDPEQQPRSPLLSSVLSPASTFEAQITADIAEFHQLSA